MGRRKQSVTIIELMICLAILLMIGGIVGVQGRSFLKSHAFRMEAQKLKSEVRVLKLLASSLDADLSLIFRYDGETLCVDMETDEKLPYLFKPISFKIDGCLLDDRVLEETRILYSRSRQSPHFIEIALGLDHLKLEL
jgi:hypothetical protein